MGVVIVVAVVLIVFVGLYLAGASLVVWGVHALSDSLRDDGDPLRGAAAIFTIQWRLAGEPSPECCVWSQ